MNVIQEEDDKNSNGRKSLNSLLSQDSFNEENNNNERFIGIIQKFRNGKK